jgi:hypothetical protein
MGKKHVIEKSEDELLKETEKIDAALKKEVKVKTTQRLRE